MKYKILSSKQNKIKKIVEIMPLILFVILAIMDICGYYVNKIILLITCIYMFLPISIVRRKYIGDFELSDQYISFITQKKEYIKLNFTDIKHCKLSYVGAKGQIHFMVGGWSWETGYSFFEIQTNDNVYKIIFLSESLEDESNLINYTEILKRNSIPYFFSLKSTKYRSYEK